MHIISPHYIFSSHFLCGEVFSTWQSVMWRDFSTWQKNLHRHRLWCLWQISGMNFAVIVFVIFLLLFCDSFSFCYCFCYCFFVIVVANSIFFVDVFNLVGSRSSTTTSIHSPYCQNLKKYTMRFLLQKRKTSYFCWQSSSWISISLTGSGRCQHTSR